MTTAIGQKFSQVPAVGPSHSGGAGRHTARASDVNAFGDLVHGAGNRDAQAAPARSGETKVAPDTAGRRQNRAVPHDAESAPADKQALSRVRHVHKIDDDSTSDKTGDGDRRDAAKADDAPPLRDRLPLLVTLNELGHRGAQPAMKPERESPGKEGATARVAGDRSGAHLPDDASQQPTSLDLAGVPALAGGKTAKAATVASLARPSGRTAESSAAPFAGTARSLAPKNAPDGPADTAPVMPVQTGPAVASGDGTSPDGQESDNDNGAGPARPGRRAASSDEPSTDSVSRTAAERRASGAVTVAADRSFPAPAAHPLSATTARVIETLATAGAQVPSGPVSQHLPAAPVAHPTHVLQIELHPAELGMVTASLRMTGEQLSIELKPETVEAYRRLSNDSDAITRSLKKLGLDIDSVTVMQPSIATPPAARVDAGNQSAFLPARDGGQFQPGTSGGSGDGFGGQQPGRNRNHDGQAPERPKPAHRQRTGDTLFI